MTTTIIGIITAITFAFPPPDWKPEDSGIRDAGGQRQNGSALDE